GGRALRDVPAGGPLWLSQDLSQDRRVRRGHRRGGAGPRAAAAQIGVQHVRRRSHRARCGRPGARRSIHYWRGANSAGEGGPSRRRLRSHAARRRRAARLARSASVMMRIVLTVNGEPVQAEVAPRTHLADFLREHLLLTGTHIGCEHGICGACTVEIDGEIARSCITYAVACDGARIRTIEGFEEDALMARLRQAFTEAHALQCGYCTPGMLIAARDLVRRKRGLTRAEIRTEMSGNLCRCTGYMGIVDAIERVMAAANSGFASPAPGAGRAEGRPHAWEQSPAADP